MKCHICDKNLPISVSSIHEYHYGCFDHFYVYFMDDRCYHYTLASYDNINIKLFGNKNFNNTSIMNFSTGTNIIKVNYIPIDLNNIDKEVSRVYNRLMRLKAFI